MQKKYSGFLLLLLAVTCWGPAPVFTKLALTEFPNWSFAFIGRIIALVVVVFLFASKGYFKVARRDLPLLILAGLTGTVFNVGFFIHGIQLTNAMDAQAIFSSGPVITAVLAVFFLKEKIERLQVLGVFIGFMGAMLIAGRTYFETGTLSMGNLYGNLLVFMASLSWVFYILISRKLSKKYSPETIILYSFLVSSIVFAPLALVENINSTVWINGLTTVGIFGVLYIGLIASVVSFVSYQRGLKLTSAFAAGVFLYIQPIITTVVAAIVLNEKITLPFIAGAALIITGSFIATQRQVVKKILRNFNFI